MRKFIPAFLGIFVIAILGIVIRLFYKSTPIAEKDKNNKEKYYDSIPSSSLSNFNRNSLHIKPDNVGDKIKRYLRKPIVRNTIIGFFILFLIASPVAESATLFCDRQFEQVNCILTYNLLVFIKISEESIHGLYDVTFTHLKDRYGGNRGESVRLKTDEGEIRAGMVSYSSTRKVRDEIDDFLSSKTQNSMSLTYYNPPVFYCLGLFIIGLLLSWVIIPRRR
jgi:hypothetical protein